MNEIQLFSMRRTIILSLVLGLITIVAVGQALDTGENDDSNLKSTQPSTSSSELPSTTSTSTQTETQTESQLDTVIQSTAVTLIEVADPITGQDQRFNQDDEVAYDASSLSNFGETLNDIFNFSLQFLLTSGLFFVLIVTFYIMVFNNSELRNYINHSLMQAGFQGKISTFGKRWTIKGNGRNFSMSLIGLRNLRMKIELPKED
ncbi:MAG: hypothetical protein ACC656_05765, partial [Candidatus Heimdallarchaeota archaeon]